jgi:uncharacterized protein YigE (DUF2233 family)
MRASAGNRFRSGALLALALLAGCARAGDDAARTSACVAREFEGSRFTVCDPGAGRIELVAAGLGETPIRGWDALEQALGKRAAHVAFAMNAGMFDTQGRPIGLSIVNGRQRHAINRRKGGGNFHLLPNGVFQVRADGRAQVLRSEDWRPSRDVRFATQSGPMLVIGGRLHPAFDADGDSRHVRNGVGIAADGRPRFVISDEPVSFGKFARLFRDGLGARDALFLDGAVSALWDPVGGRRDPAPPLGPILVVYAD